MQFLIAAILTLLLLLTSGINVAEQLDPSQMPIGSFVLPDGIVPSQFFLDLIEDDGKRRDMTEEEIETYISSLLESGSPESGPWLDSHNLFRACLMLASRKKESNQGYSQWLEIALKAAKACFEYEPNETALSNAARLYGTDDAWFYERMIDIYQSAPIDSDKDRAFALYNIGAMLAAQKEYALALQAFEAAHLLFPKDTSPSWDLQFCQKKLGDYGNALKTVQSMDSPLDEETSMGLKSRQWQHRTAGELHMELGQYEQAQKELLDAWKILCERERRFLDSPFMDLDRNRIATVLGLLALKIGDREAAIRWFKESFVKGNSFAWGGYDLRLVKELMKDPSLRELCISYLQLALEAKMTGMEDEVKALLAKLTGDQTAAKVQHAARYDKADEGMADDMNGQKIDPQRTHTEQSSPEGAKRKRINTGAVIAVIVAAIIAAVYANRRKRKRKVRGNDI